MQFLKTLSLINLLYQNLFEGGPFICVANLANCGMVDIILLVKRTGQYNS